MKDKLTGLIIVGLTAFIFFNRGCEKGSNAKGPDTLRVVDTVWQKHDSLIVKSIPVPYEIPVPYKILETKYAPDTAYPKLKLQYESLARQYASRRIYQDSVRVGKFGHIKVIDTVTENKLIGRSFKENYKIPLVKETTTITKYAEPTRQLYVGGGVNGTSLTSFRSVEAGVLYKTRKDKVFGAKVAVGVDGSVTYGISSYWKVKLKK